MTSRRGPASLKVRKIGILLVAHSGVANPEIWQYWASKAPKGSIAFYVFCNDENELEYRNEFTLKYDLKLRIPTRWCDVSVVDATLQSIEKIIAKQDGINILHVVSGHDIPINRPEEFFYDRKISFSDGDEILQRANQSCMKFFSTGFKKGFFKKTMNMDPDIERIAEIHFVEHSQWMSLTREHCILLIKARPIFEALCPIAETLLEFGESYPEEWMLGTILHFRLKGRLGHFPPSIINLDNTSVMYPAFKRRDAPQRPLVWKSLDRYPRKCILGGFEGDFTLSQVLRFEMHGSYLFFRKVANIEGLRGFYGAEFGRVKGQEDRQAQVITAKISTLKPRRPKDEEEVKIKKKQRLDSPSGYKKSQLSPLEKN